MTYLVASIFVLAMPASAAIPCPQQVELRRKPCMPSAREREQIMRLLDEVREAETALFNASQEEAALRPRARNEGGTILHEWGRQNATVEEKTAEITSKSKEILRLTQLYYGVGPNKRDGRVANGPLANSQAHWQPNIQRAENLVYRAFKADGSPFFMKYPDNGTSYATTLEDGTVFVSERVFSRALEYGDPAIIASTLHHEGAHFDGLVGKGLRSVEDSEFTALQRELAIDGDIGLVGKEIESAELQRDRLGKLSTMNRRTSPFANAGRSDSNSIEWADAQAGLRAIRQDRERLQRRLEARRAGKPEDTLRDSLRAPPTGDSSNGCGSLGWASGGVPIPPVPCVREVFTPPTPPSVVAVAINPPATAVTAQPAVPAIPATPIAAMPPADRRRNAELALIEISNRACSGADALSQEDFDRLWERVHKAPITTDSRDQYGLRGCVWKIYGDLSGYSQMDELSHLSIDWLNKRVGEIQVPVTSADPVPDSSPPPNRPRCRWAGDWCK